MVLWLKYPNLVRFDMALNLNCLQLLGGCPPRSPAPRDSILAQPPSPQLYLLCCCVLEKLLTLKIYQFMLSILEYALDTIWNPYHKEFRGKKPFIILNTYVYALFSYGFSFNPSLWWPLLFSVTAHKDHTQFHTSSQASRIT